MTLAIDLTSHQTVATWQPKCGEDGPHGLRLAEAEGLLFVACSTKVEALDVGHDGAIVGSIDTGDGVDDVDYMPGDHIWSTSAPRGGQAHDREHRLPRARSRSSRPCRPPKAPATRW